MPRSTVKWHLLWLCLLVPLCAGAGEIYRYRNDQNIVVIDRHGVPSQFIGKGYEVLNEQGLVLRVVAPAPTREELQRSLAERERAKADIQLRRLYSSLEDVDRAEARKLSEMDGLIVLAKGNLQAVRLHQDKLQEQAAEHERAGRKVPEQLLGQIAGQRDEQVRLQGEIERYHASREQVKNSFAADRSRVAELLGLKQ
jgi:hypothetical protein